jgi:OOP family OmpA-OmpF porin
VEPRSAHGTRRGTERKAGRTGGSGPETIDDLRRLLVGPEQGRLDRLEERPAVTGETVGKVLPEAVAAAAGERRDELAIALEPPVTKAIRAVARKEAELFGEILSPTIGAAVRKAVADAIAAMMQKFNEALERSLSLRSVGWRIEARRSGRPFAEVVLLHTLVFRVEEVFLIHPHTGLVLERAAAEGAGVLEPDQVASMLEAIDAFVHEAFAPLPGDVHIGRIEFGDLFLWVDRGPDAIVAALVRGVAPEAFTDLLRETRERIYLVQRDELARFESDVTPFVSSRPLLERCLAAQRRAAPKRAQIVLGIAAALAAVAIGLYSARLHARTSAEQHALDSAVAALTSQPGIVVTAADVSHGRLHIRGLRDPLAAPAREVLAAQPLPPADVEMAPFWSLDPTIVMRRAGEKLGPPEGVSLALVASVLHAHGVAPRSWTEQARRLAPTIAGVDAFDDADLRSREAVDALRDLAATLEGSMVTFPPDSSDPREAGGLVQARKRAGQLAAVAAEAKTHACLSVVGHADPSGLDAKNVSLSLARARAVVDDMVAHSVARDLLRATGAGVWRGANSAAGARSVTFQVEVGCAP